MTQPLLLLSLASSSLPSFSRRADYFKMKGAVKRRGAWKAPPHLKMEDARQSQRNAGAPYKAFNLSGKLNEQFNGPVNFF
jgi:hypothetical protein